MAKGIIVVNIPKTCGDCACCQYDGQYDRYCGVNGEDLMNIDWNGEKPDWCPIKLIPAKKMCSKSICIAPEEYYQRKGWNACIEEIERRR